MNTSSSSGDNDPQREARAYNHSIYIMVAMPYLLVGTVGLLIYRGIRAAQKTNQAASLTQGPNSQLDDRDELAPDPGLTENK